jgi:D-threo-aldose 1-dehydrogenase
MRSQRLGRTEIMLPIVGIGTAFTGIPTSEQTVYDYVKGKNPVDQELGLRTLLAALDAGCTFIDTAVLYGRALSETMIGEALRQRPHLKQDILITTKCGRAFEGHDYSYDAIQQDVFNSLERMGLERLDIVYIHDPMGYPMEDVLSNRGALGALRNLQDQGIVKYVGAAANDPLTNLPYIETGEFDAAVIADSWSLINLTAAEGIFAAAEKHDVGLVNATPLERGLLVTGPIEDGSYLNRHFSPECLAHVSQIQSLCRRYDVPMLAVALQWCARHPLVASTIPGARLPHEAVSSLEAANLEIPDDLWAELQPLVKHFDIVTES